MTSSARIVRRFRVSGEVQGVYFRASAREVARRLGLDGWARNLPDGSVEVLAAGSAEALTEFARWLATGPARARVAAVLSEVSDEAVEPGFVVR